MSQIATAYVLSEQQVKSAAHGLKESYKNFWDVLGGTGCEVKPGYQFSGSVVNVLMTFWEEHGVQMPLSLDKDLFAPLAIADVGLQVCGDNEEVAAASKELKELVADKFELHRYYNEFVNGDWDEAGDAMIKGWEFVVNGLLAAERGDKCYLLFVG